MNEKVHEQESGLRTFIIAAALLVLIGAWSAFVVWRADKTPVPASSDSQHGISLSEGADEAGGAELARRIIVYSTTSIDDGNEESTDLSTVG